MNTPGISKSNSNKALWKTLAPKLVEALKIALPDYIVTSQEDYAINLQYSFCKNISIFIRHDDWNGKLEVSAHFKHKNQYFRWEDYIRDVKSPNCGFSITRKVSDIVSGIEKRFMPNFNFIIDKTVELWALWEAQDNAKEKTVEEISAALDSNNHSQNKETIWPGQDSELRDIISSVKVGASDHITIELSFMSKEKAIKFIELIKSNF